MTKPPKILIQRKVMFNQGKNFRYYSPYYTGRKNKRPNVILNLANTIEYNPKGHKYPNAKFHTEKQFVTFLKSNFGNGEFLVLGFQKGYAGSFVFWKGVIQDDGWQFTQKTFNRSDINILKKDLESAETDDEKLEIEKEIDELTDLEKEVTGYRKYGFGDTMKSSGKRGVFHMWEEPDEGIAKIGQKSVGPKKKKTFEDMDIDDINTFEDEEVDD